MTRNPVDPLDPDGATIVIDPLDTNVPIPEQPTRVSRSAFSVIRIAAVVPMGVVAGLDRALRNLEVIANGVQAMHSEFIGMREDIRTLDRRVEALREEVTSLNEDVGQIRGATSTLDGRLEDVSRSLEGVDALATRVGRIGLRRPGRRDEQAPRA